MFITTAYLNVYIKRKCIWELTWTLLQRLAHVCMSLHQTQSTLTLSLSLSLSESTPVWRDHAGGHRWCWRRKIWGFLNSVVAWGSRQAQVSPLPCPNRTIHFIALVPAWIQHWTFVLSFSESLTFLCTPGLRRIWTASNRDCSLSPQHTFNSHSPGTVIATVVQSVLQFFLSQVILKKNTISLVKHPAHLPFLTTPYYQKYICSF